MRRKVAVLAGVLEGMTSYTTSLRKKTASLLIAPAALALVIAGCGGGGSSSSSTSKPAASAGTVLHLAAIKPGKALVDAQGRTLYLFEADKSASSRCSSGCASIWPPETVTGKATAGAGLIAADLGTTKRSDGKTQLTYNGHPLYRYVADSKAGDAKGQGLNQFGAKWYVLNAKGAKIDND